MLEPEIVADTVQLDRRLAIHADRGLAGVGGDLVDLRHEGERITLDKQVLLAGGEVVQEALGVPVAVATEGMEEVLAVACDHGVVA